MRRAIKKSGSTIAEPEYIVTSTLATKSNYPIPPAPHMHIIIPISIIIDMAAEDVWLKRLFIKIE